MDDQDNAVVAPHVFGFVGAGVAHIFLAGIITIPVVVPDTVHA